MATTKSLHLRYEPQAPRLRAAFEPTGLCLEAGGRQSFMVGESGEKPAFIDPASQRNRPSPGAENLSRSRNSPYVSALSPNRSRFGTRTRRGGVQWWSDGSIPFMRSAPFWERQASAWPCVKKAPQTDRPWCRSHPSRHAPDAPHPAAESAPLPNPPSLPPRSRTHSPNPRSSISSLHPRFNLLSAIEPLIHTDVH